MLEQPSVTAMTSAMRFIVVSPDTPSRNGPACWRSAPRNDLGGRHLLVFGGRFEHFDDNLGDLLASSAHFRALMRPFYRRSAFQSF
jgi:hypothetical protein